MKARLNPHAPEYAGRLDILASRLIPQPNGCLFYPKTNSFGYGQASVGGVAFGVHRLMWEREHGPTPAGMIIRNQCGHKQCARPDHWQLVTKSQFVQSTWDNRPRSLMPAPHCRHGHPMTEANIYWETHPNGKNTGRTYARCRICRTQAGERYRQRIKLKIARELEIPPSMEWLKRRLVTPLCVHGHPLTEANSRFDRHGHRRCLVCHKARQRRSQPTPRPPRPPRPQRPNRGTHQPTCKNGHRRTPENTRIEKTGHYRCRICDLNKTRRYQQRQQETPTLAEEGRQTA